MSKNLVTVTIGIPAYNEESNIASLISSLLKQKQTGWKLEKLLVYNDGSTDRTKDIVLEFASKFIKLIDFTTRHGQAYGQNKIIEHTDSDVLVLLNADIEIKSDLFITNLIKPIIKDSKVGMTSAKVMPLSSRTYFGRVIDWSHYVKHEIYREHKNSIYLAHGRARALSRAFYKKLKFKGLIAEDAFSYLECVKQGYEFTYVNDAIVYFRSPSNLHDQLLQSQRFFRGKEELLKEFDRKVVQAAYKLNSLNFLKIWLTESIKHPFFSASYLAILTYSSMTRSFNMRGTGLLWESSKSSKNVAGRSKNINVITTFFYPVAAGIETNILETYSELVKNGWNITVHTTKNTLTEQNTLSSYEVVRGIKVYRYHKSLLGFVPHIDYQNTSLISLHNFNIFPHLYIYMNSLIHKITMRKNYGIFVVPHGGYTPEWPIFNPLTIFLKQTYHKTIGRFMLNYLSDGIRVISVWEQNELIKVGINPSKITLIPNGLDKEALQNHEKYAISKIKKLAKHWGKYILSMGRVAVIKNYETSIRALAESSTKFKLVIVGPVQSNVYLQELRQLASDLGVGQRVIFAGVMRGSDKYYLVNHATAFLHMAKWESFCNVVYEAMSQHKLCIVADNTALTSLVDNQRTGLTTSTLDDSKLGNLLSQLESGSLDGVISKIGKNLERKDFPTWEITAIEMEKIFNRIIKQYV